MKKIKVLFVCMGNICRSPLAKIIMQHKVGELSLNHMFEIDSAGIIDYHAGENADHRSIIIAQKHGMAMNHIARKIKLHDLTYFDYIMVMDHKNYQDIMLMNPTDNWKVHYLRKYDSDAINDLVIPDPYYGSIDDFELTYQQCYRSIGGFIQSLDI